jgi:hypothetical protein
MLRGGFMASTLQSAPQTAPLQPAQSRAASVLEEGILTGIVGAAVVALWFLIIDLARGQMFFTIAPG